MPLHVRLPPPIQASHPRAEEVLPGRVGRPLTVLVPREYATADLPTPRTQLLSNGTYSVMITTSGAGYSMSGSLAVTRWRADTTRDNWGSFVYVRDVRSGSVWSTGYQPVCSKANTYEVAFSEDKADFWRRDGSIVTHLEVIVSGEDNCELRGVSITNYSTRPREIELTSYAEIVLASPSSDIAHPAFSNLFVETEFYGPQQALLAQDRKSTRLNSSHLVISYAVFCLKKKKNTQYNIPPEIARLPMLDIIKGCRGEHRLETCILAGLIALHQQITRCMFSARRGARLRM